MSGEASFGRGRESMSLPVLLGGWQEEGQRLTIGFDKVGSLGSLASTVWGNGGDGGLDGMGGRKVRGEEMETGKLRKFCCEGSMK